MPNKRKNISPENDTLVVEFHANKVVCYYDTPPYTVLTAQLPKRKAGFKPTRQSARLLNSFLRSCLKHEKQLMDTWESRMDRLTQKLFKLSAKDFGEQYVAASSLEHPINAALETDAAADLGELWRLMQVYRSSKPT